MQLYSTKNKRHFVDFKTAVFQGLPPDNGLYMPEKIPTLSASFLYELPQLSFQEIAFTIAHTFLKDEVPENDLKNIVQKAVNFPTPTISLDERTKVLELFHGPSLAFKDIGARFMAQMISYLNRQYDKEITVLVATSGDTGGAVAAGFHNIPGIRVVVLYPSGKITPLQERQITTAGGNITAVEISGAFDECQEMAKQAFLDLDLQQSLRLSSANSINIARLIPQTFYYFESWKQVWRENNKMVFVVPSGNFGNLTAGLIAREMGLPVYHFVAATNANDVVPEYLRTGEFRPKPSRRTLSNAMDVGNPSNFKRILDMYGSTWNIIKHQFDAYRFSDAETRAAMRETYARYRYLFEPHGAVGYLAWRTYQKAHPDTLGVILETAHPAKFQEEVETILGVQIPLPIELTALLDKEKQSVKMTADFQVLKKWLLDN
jgi:threonine synthase